MSTELITTIGKKTMTDRQHEWFVEYMATGNATEAARRIGITKSVSQYGQQLRMTLTPFIQANMRGMIGRTAPAALETVFDIAQNCPDPKVRLAAAQDLLNRAGYKESQVIEINNKDKSDDELNKEIQQLLERGGIMEGSIITDAEVVE